MPDLKKTITLAVSEEKLSAVEMYLRQKDTTLSAEIDKFVEQLYIKNVPQNVREYIEMVTEKKPPKKPRAAKESETADAAQE